MWIFILHSVFMLPCIDEQKNVPTQPSVLRLGWENLGYIWQHSRRDEGLGKHLIHFTVELPPVATSKYILRFQKNKIRKN